MRDYLAEDQRAARLGRILGEFLKQAGDLKDAPRLVGSLYVTQDGWALLSVPNGFARSLYDILHVPDIELPLNTNGLFNAHISVMRPEEIQKLGGADKIRERGRHFHYQLGPIVECEPSGWRGVERCWMARVESRELEALRQSYDLSPIPDKNRKPFHITIAVRKKAPIPTIYPESEFDRYYKAAGAMNSVHQIFDGGAGDDLVDSDFNKQELETQTMAEMGRTNDLEVATQLAANDITQDAEQKDENAKPGDPPVVREVKEAAYSLLPFANGKFQIELRLPENFIQISMPSPNVTVNPVINVPQQPAPVVNLSPQITMPEIRLPEQVAPVVHVAPANVEVHPAQVVVNPTIEMKMPDRSRRKLKFALDQDGNIASATSEEDQNGVGDS